MAHHHHHHEQPQYPVLLPPLRAALATLYSLPGHQQTPQHAQTNHAVHNFLVEAQSRNVRRRRQSRMQSLRDQDGKGGDAAASTNTEASVDGDRPGSIWLACLCLLTFPDAHAEERLFAAQTILGRLRRSRLSEAVDVEVEDLSITSQGVTYDVMHKYAGWANTFHPLLASAVGRCQQQQLQQQQQHGSSQQCLSLEAEERYKGQMTVFLLSAALTLASAINSGAQHSTDIMGGNGPLLSTVGSALSLAALRLRYPPPAAGSRAKTGSFPHANSGVSNPESSADIATPPLVSIVAQSVTASTDEAESSLGSDRASSHRAICAAIAALPDSILGVPGGARSRISVDPRSVRAAAAELRSAERGFHLMTQALESRMPPVAVQGSLEEVLAYGPILAACLGWANYLPLPVDFVNHTVPLAARYLGVDNASQQQHNHALGAMTKLALGYAIAIFEGATHSVEEILQNNLGLGAASAPQLNRKRQSSKSKKRQKERLNDALKSEKANAEGGNSSEEGGVLAEAEREALRRSYSSCRAAILVLDELNKAVERELTSPDGGEASGGEGPIGCVATCASACLPFLLRGDANQISNDDALRIFQSTSLILLKVSSSKSPVVRALSYSPILAVHSGIVKAFSTNKDIQSSEVHQAAIEVVIQCTMVLGNECKYPPHYFLDLTADNDEDLEIERNDVRDIIRSVAGADDSDPNYASLMILYKVVCGCAEACATDSRSGSNTQLPPETAVHTLSSLAKPFNKVASLYLAGQSEQEQVYQKLLITAFDCLGDVGEIIIQAFGDTSVQQQVIFPVSRLLCLASAAFAPAFRHLASVCNSLHEDIRHSFLRTLRILTQASAVSASRLPELAAVSSLDTTQYDIRGAMRGPGGEDHVGIIALYRIAHESTELCQIMTAAYDNGNQFSPSLLSDLCSLHAQLKQDEIARGPGVWHGRGVTPKTRRILLQTISRLGTLQSNSEAISDLYHLPIQTILHACSDKSASKAEILFQVCEAVYDLSSFSPDLICNLFSESHKNVMQSVVELVVSGYRLTSTNGSDPDQIIVQWSRLRGAFFSLLRGCKNPGLPPLALEATCVLNDAECAAITAQCNLGPNSQSAIFNDDIVGDEALPAGAFVEAIREILEHLIKEIDEAIRQGLEIPASGHKCIEECLVALHRSKGVLHVLSLPSPEATGHIDPRPSLGEAWYYAMNSLLIAYSKLSIPASSLFGNQIFSELVGESCATVIRMLVMRSIEKENGSSVGMSVDGAQTLAAVDFLAATLSLGPDMLTLLHTQIGPHIMLDAGTVDALEATPSPSVFTGAAFLGAALFRAVSGCWPPWAVEGSPQIYSALFNNVCRSDANMFCQIIEASGEIRIGRESQCGAVLPGKKLAGKYFDQMGQKTKDELMSQVASICQQNDNSAWRRMKVVLKQACGGKKKASGYNQKPSLICWDCDRL